MEVNHKLNRNFNFIERRIFYGEEINNDDDISCSSSNRLILFYSQSLRLLWNVYFYSYYKFFFLYSVLVTCDVSLG